MTKKKEAPMKNITINIPDLYDENLRKLIDDKIIESRSEGIRNALKEFIIKEFDTNLITLNFFKPNEVEEIKKKIIKKYSKNADKII